MEASDLLLRAAAVLGYPIGLVLRAHYRWLSRSGASHPNPWIRKSSEIGGWLLEGEHEFLWELACRPGAGPILEIGSWMGKSSCILAGACAQASPESRVFCVDPFDMKGPFVQEWYHRLFIHRDAGGTYSEFLRHADRLGFRRWAVPVPARSEAILPFLKPGFRMVFIDAGHTYSEVRRDAGLSLPLLSPGGVLALHDAAGPTAWPGIARYVREDLMRSPSLRPLGSRRSIVAFEKTA